MISRYYRITFLLYCFIVTNYGDLLFLRFPTKILMTESDEIVGPVDCSFVQRNEIGRGQNASVYSVAPKVAKGMALKDDDGYLYERLHRWSPLGHIEVVAKVFSDLKKEPVVALCDGDAIVKTCIDLEDAKEERKRLQRKIDIKTIYLYKDDEHFFTTGFVNEILVHTALSTLVHLGVTPHIADVSYAAKNGGKGKGYLMIERLDATLDDVLNDEDLEDNLFDKRLDCVDIAIIYFQFLHTLHICQRSFAFKHHDLHPDNVFITLITDESFYNGRKLCDFSYFEYVVDGVSYFLPNRGFLLKFADFGLSSISVGQRRIGRIDMDCFNNEKKNGAYGRTILKKVKATTLNFSLTIRHTKKIQDLLRVRS